MSKKKEGISTTMPVKTLTFPTCLKQLSDSPSLKKGSSIDQMIGIQGFFPVIFWREFKNFSYYDSVGHMIANYLNYQTIN